MTILVSNAGRCFGAVLLVTLSSAGCTVHGPDAPPPDSPAPGQAAPQRPRELSLTGKQDNDICGLLAAEHLNQLGIAGAHPHPGKSDAPATAAGCTWSSPPGIEPAFGINLYSRQIPIDQFKTESGEPFPETAASYDISGFRAEQLQDGTGFEQMGCSVGVDVAHGQTIEAFMAPALGGTVSNQDMCAKAKQAAEFAVGNLQAQG